MIPLGGSGSFYESFVTDPCTLVDPSDATKLVQWFSAVATSGVVNSIGRVTSTVADPYTWGTPTQVMTHGGSGAFDEGGCRLGSVIYVSGTYYMYYTGFSGNQATFSIGYATSSDGVTWSKQGSVLTPTGQGRTDGDGTKLDCAAVIKEGSSWTMIYSYYDTGNVLPGFRYATSSDGATWTKGGSGDILTTLPLNAEMHKIYHIDGVYWLIYEAGSSDTSYRIFAASAIVATGPYVNCPFNPIFLESGVPATFDLYHVATPDLIFAGGSWILFYSGAGQVFQPYFDNTLWPLGVATYVERPTGLGNRS